MADKEERPQVRKRASSVAKTLQYMQAPPKEHRLGEFAGGDAPVSPVEAAEPPTSQAVKAPQTLAKKEAEIPHWLAESEGFFHDIYTMKWMRIPASSLKIIALVLGMWSAFHVLQPDKENPIDALIRISYPLPRRSLLSPFQDDRQFYTYGWKDLWFLAFYVIVFSFVRQASTEYLLRPVAKFGGIKREAKIQRFVEQGYAVLYFTVFGSLGIHVMRGLPTWWYKTEYFWLDHPHKMTPEIKTYYLLQLSYWLQQMLVLVLKIEKPRPDFVELCIHHCVTLWLVGWSYSAHLTRIGNAIFVTMDVSDVWLSVAKCLNYLKFQRTSEIVFAFFLCVWTYLRHYLNLKILWSVVTEYDTLVPAQNRYFEPGKGIWLAPWFKYQVFTPIMLLQLVNLFWYYLIWRIIIRILLGQNGTDIREESEDEEETAKKQQ